MRQIIPCAIAAALLVASPAPAATDPLSSQMLSAADACLDVAKGADPGNRFTASGFVQHNASQWYVPGPNAMLVVVVGSGTDAKGGKLQSCTATTAPAVADYSGLLEGVRQRATAYKLAQQPDRILPSGSTSTVFERFEESGVVSIAMVKGKATEKLPAGTSSVVVLWRKS